MSTVEFQLAYDGEDVRGHTMDVQELAPALMALGNLIRDANTQINGDRSKVKVFVQSDFEHKCFLIHFEVVQTILSHIGDILGDHNVKEAKDILEWLGLLGLFPGGLAGGVIALLRWRKKKDALSNSTVIEEVQHGGLIRITSGDGSSITINQTVYDLSNNPKIRSDLAGVFSPLKKPGIDAVKFSSNSREPSFVSYGRDDADAIIAASEVIEPDKVLLEPQTIIANLRVHSPVFDPKAEKWRFKYGEEIIYADITGTTIASDALRRGSVAVNDRYKVRLEITEHETPQGQFRNTYKVVEVLEFTPAPRQQNLF